MSKIFVALATYNGERFLAQMLDSLLRQTRPADRIFAVDDASKDSSAKILDEYATKLPMQIFVRQENGGPRAAFSDALQAIRQTAEPNDLVAIADQDDIWLLDKIEVLEKRIDEKDSPHFVFGDACVMDANEKDIANSWRSLAGISPELSILSRLSGTNNANGCLSLFRASLLEKILPIPEWVPVYDEWIALCAAKFGNIRAVPEVVLKYRLHGKNAVGIAPKIAMSKALQINIRFAEGLLTAAERLHLAPQEIRFLERYGEFLRTSLEHSPNFFEIPWLWQNRSDLYPGCSFPKQLKKILGTSLGFPFCKRFLGKS